MRIVGLTGGIGSGKSVVASMFRECGATVVDADALAREVVEVGSEGFSAVVARFGSEILAADGAIDRRLLGRLVFSDEHARADLEALLHPRVHRLAQERFEIARRSGAKLTIYDVPLLYEAGLDAELPTVIVVYASTGVRRARILARDHLPKEDIDARMAAQMPLEEKTRRAVHVIDNDGDLSRTRARVRELYDLLTKEETKP